MPTVGIFNLRPSISSSGIAFADFNHQRWIHKPWGCQFDFVLGIERQAFIAKFGSLVAVLNIALDLILIPMHGALGAAIANCSAQVLGTAGGMIYVSRCLRVNFPWAVTLTTYSAAGLATALAAWMFRSIQPGILAFVVSFIVMAALYVFMLVLCGVVNRTRSDCSTERDFRRSIDLGASDNPRNLGFAFLMRSDARHRTYDP